MTIPDNYGYVITYTAGEPTSITCCQCGLQSYNSNDVKHVYCGHCHLFHDLMLGHSDGFLMLTRDLLRLPGDDE